MGPLLAVLVVVGAVWLIVAGSRRGRRSRGDAAGGGRERAGVVVDVRLVPEPAAARSVSVEERRAEREREAASALLEQVSGEFCADVSRSPNGRFVVGAVDSGSSGRLMLVDAQARRVLFKARLARPNYPKVSNDGWVVVESWGTGEKPGSKVIAYDPGGNRAWARALKANVYSTGVSPGGGRAFITTAFAPGEAHSDRLFLLDARSGEDVWERSFGRRSPEGFTPRFDGERLVAVATDATGAERVFAFDESGALGSDFERFALEKDIAWNGVEKAVLPRVREALKASPPRLEEAEDLLGLVTWEGLEATPRGKLTRLRGELHEARGELAAAAAAYREALELYPRAGVKGRLEALEKRLG